MLLSTSPYNGRNVHSNARSVSFGLNPKTRKILEMGSGLSLAIGAPLAEVTLMKSKTSVLWPIFVGFPVAIGMLMVQSGWKGFMAVSRNQQAGKLIQEIAENFKKNR